MYIYIARETRASGVHVVIIYRRNTTRLYGGPGVFIADADPGFRYAAVGRTGEKTAAAVWGKGRGMDKKRIDLRGLFFYSGSNFYRLLFFVPRFDLTRRKRDRLKIAFHKPFRVHYDVGCRYVRTISNLTRTCSGRFRMQTSGPGGKRR